jgi:collagen type VII alpha
MARHLSGRQPRLNVGVTSYTDSLTVLQVTGKVAIGTTNAGNYSLYVVGDANIVGEVGLTTIRVSSGIITNLAGTNLNYAGIGTINNFISTTASINTLDGNIVRYNTGIITSLSGNNLYYRSGIITNILGTNLNYTGIGTVNNFISTTANITNLSGSNLRFNSGIITTLQGTNIFYNGIGTIGSFISTNSTILTLSGSAVRYSSGIVTNISGTNLNYSGISTFNAASGPLFVGSATSTNTPGQTFQVVGVNSGAFFGGNVGIGSTRPTSKLSVQGDVLVSGVVTSLGAFVGVLTGPAEYAYSAGFTTVAVHAGVATEASVAGFATVAIQAGVTTIAAVAGFATVASIAGYTTYSGTAGFSSFASISGFATVSSVAGFATVATHSGVTTIASVAGFATNATRAGLATLATYAYSAGFTTFSGVAGFATVATQAGISTTVIGGIANVTQLNVSGISTFNVGIFSGNTTSDLVRITQLGTGNAFVVEDFVNPDSTPFVIDALGDVGIGTTNPSSILDVRGTTRLGTGSTYVEVGSDAGRNIEIGVGSTIYDTYVDFYGTPTYNSFATRLVRNTGDNSNFDIVNRGTGAIRLVTQDAGSIEVVTTNAYRHRIDPNGVILAGAAVSTGTGNQILQVGTATTQFGAYFAGNVGIGSTNPPSKLSVVGDVSVIGVVTANNFFGPLTGIAASATQLVTPRTFNIVGAFVTAANILFDGTANVSFAATIVPDSIGLGTYTYGDYVRYITGTTNQIVVTGGLGEGSTPQIGLATNVTIQNNVNIGNDLFVGGNVTVAGTSFVLSVDELRAENKEIVLGFTTTATPNDTSANFAAIAIASTEGTPLVPLTFTGLTTLPATYKQLRWVKSGTWSGLATDAFIFNYGVGIGSTNIPFGVRLAVGSGIQMTDTNISSPQGTFSANLLSANTISASNQQNSGVTTSLGGFRGNLTGAANYAYAAGFSTFSSTAGFSTVASIAGFTTVAAVAGFATNATRAGVATFSSLAGSAGFATVATQAGIATNTIGGVVDVNALRTTGIATFSSISVGGTTGTNQYVLTSTGLGLQWQAVTGIGAISGVNITSDNTNKVYYIPFVNVSAGTTATQYVDTSVGLVYNPGTEQLGIGTTNPGSTLDIRGTLYVSDYITSPTFYGNFVGVTSGVTFYAYNAGVSTIASVAGFATNATRAGVATFSTLAGSAGFATVSTVAGVATFSTLAGSAGFATVSSVSGFSTVSSVAGFATVAIQAGVSTIAAVAGFATNATRAGLATFATLAGTAGFSTVASVAGFATNATRAGVATFANTAGVAGFATYAGNVGFATFAGIAGFATVSIQAGVATISSVAGFATVATQAGISTSVVGGVANVVSLNVSGISTLVGFTTFQQNVFVAGVVTASDGRLIAGVGIQSAGLIIGTGVTTLNFIGLGNTFLVRGTTVDISIQGGGGGGTNLSISTTTSNQFQFVPVVSTASTNILGISNLSAPFVFVPSSGNLGIGTTVPTQKLHVLGNVVVAAGTSTAQFITQKAYELNNGTLSWEGSAGQLFSITNNLTSGSIFAVNDVSGIPSIDVDANGRIQIAPYSGNVGLGTTNPTSKLHVIGDVLISGVTTSTGGFRGQLTGVSNYSYASGFSTFSGVAGFSTVASVAGFATVSTQAGVSSFSAFANLAGAAGFSTFSSTSGFSTFASISGFSTVAAVAGFSSVSTRAGVSTIASVAGFSTFASTAGFSTFASTSGFSTMATIAGIATNVVTGVASIRSLQVTGISTFTFGPVYIGAGQTVGITSAVVQIAGINSSMYVGGKVGIGTSDFRYALNINGDINTSGAIRVNGRNILDDAVIFAIALG